MYASATAITSAPIRNLVFTIAVLSIVGGLRPRALSWPGGANIRGERRRRAHRRRPRSPSCPASRHRLGFRAQQPYAPGDEVGVEQDEVDEVHEQGPEDRRRSCEATGLHERR